MNKQNGNGKNSSEYRKCKTPGCTCTANADTGYCVGCEIVWKRWASEMAGWVALRDAAQQNGARRRSG